VVPGTGASYFGWNSGNGEIPKYGIDFGGFVTTWVKDDAHGYENFGLVLSGADADTLLINGKLASDFASAWGTTGDYFYNLGSLLANGQSLELTFTATPSASASLTFFAYDNDAVTPEPATLAMFGLGLAGLGVARRRLRK